MRFFWIPLGLAVALMIPFLIWDEWFTRMFSGDELVIWLRAREPLVPDQERDHQSHREP